MDVPIEAKSLASLLNLASDPPRYPRNITHDLLEPLTLYIVRVPGSQDVFLTPLKPPTRASITAEAISTSLYYLHVSTVEDLALRESQDLKQSNLAAQLSPAPSINRKPLPGQTHFVEVPLQPQQPATSFPDHQLGSLDVSNDIRSADPLYRAQNIKLNTDNLERSDGSHRKPIGPRPLPPGVEPDSSPIKRKPVGGVPGGTRSRGESFGSPVAAFAQTQESQTYPRGQHPTESVPGEPSQKSAEILPDSHITIIRRDPGSGFQWNVGTISLTNDPSTDSNRVDIEITTPGYQKFARENSFPKPGDIDLAALMKNTDDGLLQRLKVDVESEKQGSSPESQYFTRYLTMPRPRTRTARSRSGSDPATLLQTTVSKVASPAPATRPPVYMPGFNPAPPLSKGQHFTYLSPWQGTCTFSTAMDGRSLKCRHVLPSSGNSEGGTAPHAPVVAELRFNLPWPVMSFDALKKKDPNERAHGHQTRPSLGDTAKHSWKSSMQKLKDLSMTHYGHDPFTSPPQSYHTRHNSSPNRQSQPQPHYEAHHHQDGYHHRHTRDRSYSSNPDTDPEDASHGLADTAHAPMDLSLAREKAGGGRGGSSAKLGKLIIRDEGQKMMDLVIAASMGVWWGIHNRDR